jgi:hypothetical protein
MTTTGARVRLGSAEREPVVGGVPTAARPGRPAGGSRPSPARADVSVDRPIAETPGSEGGGEAGPLAASLLTYQRDLWERSVLFWDTLRERAENMLAHERQGMPPLLDFDYETLLDARRLARPANYALLRITRVGDHCIDDCLDPAKPPVIVLDPRAGHGPGIGGFKQDSEVGMAMHDGHPVYFVVFFPEPCPGQTLADVRHALRRFVDEVARRHPRKPPVLYGNCQAGWAAALLAADCEGLAGPVVMNGSPLSYWAGEPGVNPMRLAGALFGGAWLARLLADLGDGRFDGAWLVQNFESLKPEAAWAKYTDLLAAVDTERRRFLAFERWWGGFYKLGREEITAIVENLFIGNRLEEGRLRICEGCEVDLRRIRSPLVIFASNGDNITPPHQALGWIRAVWGTTEALQAGDQRIVYLTNPHIGHLGIFVSAKVARLEHRAILEHLAVVEALPPGLYEMRIDNPTGDPDCARDQYRVRFEPRRVEDLGFEGYPRAAFERARLVSEANIAAYEAWLGPLVRMASTPASALWLEWLHPMRVSRYALSQRFLPWMEGVHLAAEAIARQRTPLPPDDPWLAAERRTNELVSAAIGAWRAVRDRLAEHAFAAIYERPAWRPAAPAGGAGPTDPS